jgi:putative flavoprotein involved in K+ transport
MHVETVIVGAGQAGLALSRQLAAARHEHVVLERGRVGERWRSERWDSLRMLTPNWLNRLPGAAPPDDPDGYLDRLGFVAQLDDYASGLPVHEGATVRRVRRLPRGYHVSTDERDWHARNVVIATGDCAVPRLPAAAAGAPADVESLHASRYRRAGELPDGGVLVVGAGPSGQQLTAELLRAGRDVVLAAGRHARMPRSYRGRDIFAWLLDIGQLDVHVDEVADVAAARRAPSFPVSGAHGGESLGLDRLARMGAVVTGRLEGFDGRRAVFGPELRRELADADRRAWRTLAQIEAHVDRHGICAPPAEPLEPVSLPSGPAGVELGRSIRTVLFATGYARAYPWLEVPVVDAAGELVQREGITPAPGLYALGLRFQRRRRSHFIGGVGDDAAFIAGAILERPAAERLPRAA